MASPVDTSVKYFTSAMVGAPVINGVAGSRITTLDAVLVNGFGAKGVDSAVISGGKCRLNFSTGKSCAELHSVILVEGATNPALNGEQRVTAIANNYVEFATAEEDGVVSGAINFKMAPLGWGKVFSATNKAVYRPLDPASTRTYLRVDDAVATQARLRMYESMIDVDTGIGAAPTTVSGGYYFFGRENSAATASYWVIVGDSRAFYLLCNYSTSSGASSDNKPLRSYFFGDINSYRSGDAWGAMLAGASAAANPGSTSNGCVFAVNGTDSAGFTLKRGVAGIGAATQVARSTLTPGISGMTNVLGAFPAPADNSLRLSKIVILDGADGAGPRGEMPGALYCLQSGALAGFGSDAKVVDGEGDFAGKKLLSVHVGQMGSSSQGVAFFDITGPWRT